MTFPLVHIFLIW